MVEIVDGIAFGKGKVCDNSPAEGVRRDRNVTLDRNVRGVMLEADVGEEN